MCESLVIFSHPFCTTLFPTGPKPSNVRLAVTTDSSIVVTCAVPPQIQFDDILTEWKVTLQKEGGTNTFETSPFIEATTQLTVNHLLPATRYTVWVSVKAGSAEGPLSNGLQVTTQEGGEVCRCSRCEVSAYVI